MKAEYPYGDMTPTSIREQAVALVRENIKRFPREKRFAVTIVPFQQDYGVDATVICRIDRRGEIHVIEEPEA